MERRVDFLLGALALQAGQQAALSASNLGHGLGRVSEQPTEPPQRWVKPQLATNSPSMPILSCCSPNNGCECN